METQEVQVSRDAIRVLLKEHGSLTTRDIIKKSQGMVQGIEVHRELAHLVEHGEVLIARDSQGLTTFRLKT